jgi:hypothetical protein
LLYSILFICILLPGCSTIPNGNKPGTFAISEANNAVFRVGARYLRKEVEKIESPNQNNRFPLSTVPDPAVQTTLSIKSIETVSIKGPTKTLMNLMLDMIFYAVGKERNKPKAHNLSDMLSEINQCYLTDDSINDPLLEIDSKQKDSPTAKYHDKGLFLGYRWRF